MFVVYRTCSFTTITSTGRFYEYSKWYVFTVAMCRGSIRYCRSFTISQRKSFLHSAGSSMCKWHELSSFCAHHGCDVHVARTTRAFMPVECTVVEEMRCIIEASTLFLDLGQVASSIRICFTHCHRYRYV